MATWTQSHLESEREQRNSGWSRSAHTPIKKRISEYRDTISSSHPLCFTKDLHVIDMKERFCLKIAVSIPRRLFTSGQPQLVFRLGRIFRLERSAIFMTEFRVRLELGAINFHLKPCMFTWAKIGSPFEVIILALYSNVSSYHLISTRFLITT